MAEQTNEQTKTEQVINVTQKVMDLDTLTELTLVKQFTFTPVADAASALALLGNDAAKFMEIVNAGLKDFQRESVRENAEPWHTFAKDGETGEESETINGPYTGTPVNMETVGPVVLNLAKMFGFTKGASLEAKRAAKAKAWETIKASPAILDALKPKQAEATA